jgi:hypothetical protein
MQTLQEKAMAVESVFWLLGAHHDLITRVRSSLGNVSPSEGEPAPYRPPVPECSGDCPRCPIAKLLAAGMSLRPQCPPDEAWVLEERRLRRAYRLDAVTRAYEVLARAHPLWALAMGHEHGDVIPFRAWNPAHRRLWARLGARYMAGHIRGDLPCYQPHRPRRRVEERLEEVRELRARGWSRNRITKRLHMSARDVSAIMFKLREQDTLNEQSSDKGPSSP